MSILSPALLGAVALVLLASGRAHALGPGALRRGLDAHAVLPRAWHVPLTVFLPVAEVTLGLALLGSLTGMPLDPGVPGAGAAALCAGFATYLTLVLRRHPDEEVPCACGLGAAPVSGPAVGRAGLLAVFALAGVLTAQGWSLAARPVTEVLVTAGAALSIAVATALLPAARTVPRDPELAGLPGGAR